MSDDWMTDAHKAAAANVRAEDERKARTAAEMVVWVREQISEDRTVALACAGAPWVDDVPGMVHVDPAAIRDSKWTLGHLGYVASADNSPTGDAYRAHIVRHDPRAAHARCDALEAILDRYEASLRVPPNEISSFVRGQDDGYRQACLDAARDIAVSMARRPGFREEWRDG